MNAGAVRAAAALPDAGATPVDADDAAIRARCDELAASLLAGCERAGLAIATAESLTGGLLADAFVRIPGASRVFLGSAVTYDIAAKASLLGVDRGLLDREGAVHPEVARQMAVGAARLYTQPGRRGRVLGLSTTGVAGPGPDGDKPAGLVYLGFCVPDAGDAAARPRTEAVELRLAGDRPHIRLLTVLRVLENVSRFTVFSQE